MSFLTSLIIALTSATVFAADAPKMKMTTSIPQEITMPDSVQTRLGTLKFFDGLPDQATVQKLYDNLDFMRAVEVYLNTMAAASSLAQFTGLRSVGADNQTVVLHENRVDAKTLLLTPNTQTATLWGFMNLKDGPIVGERGQGVDAPGPQASPRVADACRLGFGSVLSENPTPVIAPLAKTTMALPPLRYPTPFGAIY